MAVLTRRKFVYLLGFVLLLQFLLQRDNKGALGVVSPWGETAAKENTNRDNIDANDSSLVGNVTGEETSHNEARQTDAVPVLTDNNMTLAPSDDATSATAAPTPSLSPLVNLTESPTQSPTFTQAPTSNSSDGCVAKFPGEATLTNFPRRHKLQNLVNITQKGRRPLRKAICVFDYQGNYLHFPHVFQQFARCFSFFQYYPNLKPYIVRRPHSRFRDTFNLGLSLIFQEVFDGTIAGKIDNILTDNSVVATPLYDTGHEEGPYQGIAFKNSDHADILRDRTAAHYNLTVEGCRPGKEYPVIGILNRAQGNYRHLRNAEALQAEVAELTDSPVDIVFFENASFVDQVQYMLQTDLVLSPHGAQLSSINFIPPCGGVLEFFPLSFWFPHFFGPLAASSGLMHGYVYGGKNHVREWTRGGLRDPVMRTKVRHRDVCLPLETAIPLIELMVDSWKLCCQERLLGVGEEPEA